MDSKAMLVAVSSGLYPLGSSPNGSGHFSAFFGPHHPQAAQAGN